jgi:hypothetical protein
LFTLEIYEIRILIQLICIGKGKPISSFKKIKWIDFDLQLTKVRDATVSDSISIRITTKKEEHKKTKRKLETQEIKK